MQYTKIPGTDMQASRICLGTMTFGSPVAGPDAMRLVRYALEEHGVNFIDTANMYEGYNRYAGSAGGVAEEIVGEAVAHRRGDYILATKVGMKVGEAPEDENTSPEAIRIQLRRSLARMLCGCLLPAPVRPRYGAACRRPRNGGRAARGHHTRLGRQQLHSGSAGRAAGGGGGRGRSGSGFVPACPEYAEYRRAGGAAAAV